MTQKQLKDAMARVGAETRRNAQGIKTVNSRIGSLGGRVDGVVTVNQVQTTKIGKLEKQMKIDGVLELVESYDGTTVNLYQVLKGAVKSGFLGDAKGAAGNPWVIGGVGFLLRNPGILGSLGGGTIP